MADRARLRIVAGKGGVGRTTIAAALAERPANASKRVLVVEALPVGSPDGAKRFGSEPEVVTTSAGGRVHYLRLSTQASLDEYVSRTLRLPIKPSRLGSLASIFDFVSVAAPGVREILMIGKIGHEVLNGGWDEVVVDAPASGHVVEMLTAPRELGSMVGGVGPLARESGWLDALLCDEATSILVVTLPEPLAASETRELVGRLATTDVAIGAMVINRIATPIDPDGLAEAARLADRDDRLGRLASLAASLVEAQRQVMEDMSNLADGRPVALVEWSQEPVVAAIEALSQLDPLGL